MKTTTSISTNSNKKKTASKKIAKEIVINAKLVFISLVATLLFFVIYYSLNQPHYVSYDNQQKFNQAYEQRIEENYYATRIAFGDIFTEYLGYSKYDINMSYPHQFKEINDWRKIYFKEDLNDTTLIVLLCLIGVTIIGRYLFLFVRWVNRNSMEEQKESSAYVPQASVKHEIMGGDVVAIVLIIVLIIMIIVGLST